MRSLGQQSLLCSLVLPGLLALFCACSFEAPSLLGGDASPDGGPGGPGADGPAGENPVEPLELMMSATSKDVAEGATATIDVRLRFKPATDVTFMLTSSNPAAASVPSSLTFTQTNYATAQSLVITGHQDDDTANEAVTITFSALGISNSSLTVNVIDNDTMALVLGATTVSLGEATSNTFTVSLTAQPPGNTTVTLSHGDVGAISVTPSSLTFTRSNWSIAQQVNVTGVTDMDMANESVPITVSGSGMTSRTVTANVVDDDTQSVQMTPSNRTITEGSNGTVSVRLSFQPASNVTVTLTSSNLSAATANPTTLMFTSTNYDTAQTVTITGVQDANLTQESATITASSSGAASASTAVIINDDDTMAILTSVPTLVVDEWNWGSFMVRLSAQPASDLVISIGSSDSAAASTHPTTLTFTPNNWDLDQSVSVNGVSDNDHLDESVTITLTGNGGALSRSVGVTVRDIGPFCGDFSCDLGEDMSNCPGDCGSECGPFICLQP